VDRFVSTLGDLRDRVTLLWQAQSRQNQIIAGSAAVIGIVGVIALGFLFFGRAPSYQTLFTNLSSEDAAAVTARLKDDKVPYTISGDGKTVSVPETNVSDERVSIAGSGLLKGGGSGYELFDKVNFGMTEFQEKLDKTRAVEGELQRTIDGLDPVESSRVAIATPDQSLYSSQQLPTTASIAIKAKPGQALSQQEVKGITSLVANSVEGLKPENVTIVDSNGQILLPGPGGPNGSTGGDGSVDALRLTQEQLLAKERYESALQQSIQSMLDDTLGPKHAVARVSTKMDFDANQSESKIYSPQGTVLSSQTQRESYTGNTPNRQAVGIPGTTSNIGTYQGIQGNTQSGKYNGSKATTNYDVSEQNVKHIDAPGKVTNTSVAVLVNSAVPAPGTGATATTQTAYALTPANVQQLRNAVIAAAGLNPAQGDQVSVEAIPFNPSLEGNANGTTTTTTVFGIPVWVLAVIGGIGVLALIGLLATRARRSRFAPASELPAFDTSLAEELPSFEEHPILEGAPGMAAPIRSAADLTREQMIEYVTTVAQENPDSIAKLVKLWLAE
jgi:flagellar M-ring protein FliF